jgi:hypothetical protein
VHASRKCVDSVVDYEVEEAEYEQDEATKLAAARKKAAKAAKKALRRAQRRAQGKEAEERGNAAAAAARVAAGATASDEERRTAKKARKLTKRQTKKDAANALRTAEEDGGASVGASAGAFSTQKAKDRPIEEAKKTVAVIQPQFTITVDQGFGSSPRALPFIPTTECSAPCYKHPSLCMPEPSPSQLTLRVHRPGGVRGNKGGKRDASVLY